jgi:hypothetical protein
MDELMTWGKLDVELIGDAFVPIISIAFCCAPNVVETMGHPFPGPFKFCKVTEAAFNLADRECVELSVGKDT